MADQTATWALRLKDELSGAAEQAAQALTKLQKSIAADTRELIAMEKALKNLQKAVDPSKEQIGKLTERILAQKQAIAKAQQNIVALGGNFTSTGGKGKRFDALMAQLKSGAQAMPGPIGSFASKLTHLKNALGGGAISGGILAIGAALGVLVVATVAAIAALYRYGTAQADARRSELLRLEGLATLTAASEKAPGAAKAMQATIDRVAMKTPLARAEIVKYAAQIDKLALTGPAAAAALEGVALAAAVQGEESAQAFLEMAVNADRSGESVTDLTAAIKSQLGGTAKKMMASLTVQTEKQKEAFDALFAGLAMDEYLGAWQEVNDAMSQSTASGRALKVIVSGILQPLIDMSASAAPIVKVFFSGMINVALKLLIVFLELRIALLEVFGGKTKASALEANKWFVAGKVAAWGFAIALGLAAAAALRLSLQIAGSLVKSIIQLVIWSGRYALQAGAKMVTALISLAAQAWAAAPAIWATVLPMLPFIAAAIGVGLAIYQLVKYWDELVIAFEQLDWAQAGLDIISGLLKGLLPGPLVDHMVSLAGQAIAAFKKAIGSASPAKAFVKVGKTIPEGVTEGIDDGTPAAQRAAAGMVDVPQLGGTQAPAGDDTAGSGAGAAGGGRNITIEIGQISVNSTSDKPQQLAIDFRRELERVLEGLAIELGAPVPGGAT